MEIKNNMPDGYLSDKDARKERVVVALSGGIDSFVAAYLLKIQKYDLVAVTVGINWESFSGDQSSYLSCHLNQQNLNSIKDFCQQLNIPHFFIKSTSEFQESVVEEWLASKLSARTSNACWNCHDLRMKILFQKMKQLGINSLATGHFAKIFYQESQDSIFVHTSNDEQFDQSALLSRLPKEILKSLHLPLSDLQKKEVLKLAENFGLNGQDKKIRMHECFSTSTETTNYLIEKIPPKLIKNGEIMNSDGTISYGNHNGIINYLYAGPIEKKDHKKDEIYVVKYIGNEKKIIAEKENFFLRNEALLVDCFISEDTYLSEPIKAYAKINDNFVDCWLHPKSLNAVYVQLEDLHFIKEGEILSLHRKKGKNSKIYLTGRVVFLPKEIQHEGEDNVKVDYSRDF
ncbi:MAG: hypothetical protein AB7I27_11625 [Bacteriovoracaceae bacterium]